ncbi:MAG: hypothetical protein R3B06_11800 [Kofleriaceae bacterium]
MIAAVALAAPALAQPTPGPARSPWTDTEAAIAALVAPIDAQLAACVPGRTRTIGVTVTTARDGTARAGLPLSYLGYRGPTPADRCLGDVVGSLTVPPLPPGLAQLSFAYTIGAPPPADPAWTAWRDPVATIAAAAAADRAALAACTPAARTLRVTVDTRRGRTRAWLPAWPYHAADGSGTTPPALRRVKACHAKVVRAWSLPRLPATLGELQVVLPDR